MSRALKVIDISDFDKRKLEIGQELLSAAEGIGFFYVSGHGIPQEEIDAGFAVGKTFFDQPSEFKNSYHFQSEAYMGWRSTEEIEASTGVPSPWEAYQVGYDKPMTRRKLWPDPEVLPEFREKALRWMRHCNRVSEQIAAALALALGLPEEYFLDAMDTEREDSLTACNWMHYPDVSHRNVPPGQLRLHPHADNDLFTLLFQTVGQPGLEVCPGKEADVENPGGEVGSWAPRVWKGSQWTKIDPLQGCITVNIGDEMMRWTDDRLKSTHHRVRAPQSGEYQGERYSIAYFNLVRGSYAFQGPLQKYPKVTGLELTSAEGSQYVKVSKTAGVKHLSFVQPTEIAAN